jgi:FdhE protein
MAQRILTSGEIERLAAETPALRLPARAALFGDRAARLRQLADGHPMEGYLALMAEVADAQHGALAQMPPVPLPAPGVLDQCRAHGMPPLNSQTHHRERAWCDVLRRMLRVLSGRTEGEAQRVIVRLEGERDELFEAQASKLLAGIRFGLDPARAPFIGAALQVYWVHMVDILGAQTFAPIDAASVCPACGSRPVASVVRTGGREGGHRYLHCSLCSTEWHMVRIKCSHCESTEGVHYHGIEGSGLAVLAESCDACGTYLKILNRDKEPRLDATADDLASTALDLLMADAGKLRSGQNFMLVPGDED